MVTKKSFGGSLQKPPYNQKIEGATKSQKVIKMMNLDVELKVVFDEIVSSEYEMCANALITLEEYWTGDCFQIMTYDIVAEDNTNDPTWDFYEFIENLKTECEEFANLVSVNVRYENISSNLVGCFDVANGDINTIDKLSEILNILTY